MKNTLQTLKPSFDLAALIRSAKSNVEETGLPPVDQWEPDFCGEMDLRIRSDGSWWHEGSRITRAPLIRLFSTILRKDEDGETYLVTPVEKIKIHVEAGHFLATRLDVKGEGENQEIFFSTNMGDIIKLGAERPLRVETDALTLEPSPFVRVRGRLEAMLTRSVFYELVEYAVERHTDKGAEFGVYGGGAFFPLGPTGIIQQV